MESKKTRKRIITKDKAIEAVRVLLSYIGDDPDRPGLLDTPRRVIESYEDHFCGYNQDPSKYLKKQFEETNNYQEIISLEGIEFSSICEHHLAPIIGHVSIAYKPKGRIVGISKLARIVDAFAKRLQLQERLTQEIGQTIDKYLEPKATGVLIEARHLCLETRGVCKRGSILSSLYTSPNIDEKLKQEITQALR